MGKSSMRFSDFLVPRVRIYLAIIFLLIVSIIALEPIMAVPGALIFILVLYYSIIANRVKHSQITRYIENLTFNMNTVTRDTLLNFPLPLVAIELDGAILWSNSLFEETFRGTEMSENYLQGFLKELELDKLIEAGKSISKSTRINERQYMVLGNLVQIEDKGQHKQMIVVLYFIDNTEYAKLLKKYTDEQADVGLIVIDNYDDLMQSVEDENWPGLTAEIDKRIKSWCSFTGGILKQFERDKYLFIYESGYLKQLEERKFDIIDSIKELDIGNKIPVTLSIGVGSDGASFYERLKQAAASIDIALGRGGDQAVIKKGEKYTFYGARSKEVEKRTRVKARVVTYALRELMEGSENVMIMGHENADIDCIGAALGIYRLAKTRGKEAYIILNNAGITLDTLFEKIEKSNEYDGVFIHKNQALDKISKNTLLVVVDAHRASFVANPELLKFTEKVVVIDHHIRGTDFIEDAILVFHEIYASSTCELVTEILQYMSEEVQLQPLEAEALYAGIMVDTKNFTFKTGVRTFEAAAFLKRAGIDIMSVKQLFQNDLETYIARAEIVKSAEIIKGKIAVSICQPNTKNSQLITAQAADELLGISGVAASFVLCEMDGGVIISGRSNGDINVQLILEKLGGGGHITVAGTQMDNVSVEEAKEKLETAVDEYLAGVSESETKPKG